MNGSREMMTLAPGPCYQHPVCLERLAITVIVITWIGLIGFGSGCTSHDSEKARQSHRLWGQDRIASRIEERAKQTLDPYSLDSNDSVKNRVLEMEFAEVVARSGFVEYKGLARFELVTPARTFNILEDTTIQHGLDGSFRVLQVDEDGDVAREIFYDNGILFIRNGGGEMRVQENINDQHLKLREEAWQPLRAFTRYFGERCGLKKIGSSSVGGRSTAKYSFTLLPGPSEITVPGISGAKKPVSLSGDLQIDDETSVPIHATLKGALDVPMPTGKGTKGQLNVSLNYTIKSIDGVELKPASYIPTIRRHPQDLAPLAFLTKDTHTSTVIGGRAGGGKAGSGKSKPRPSSNASGRAH